MVDYAEHQFRMGDDMSLADIDPPRLEYIWRWFLELSDCREIGMTAGSIQHQEILAWGTLHGIDVSASETFALRRLDRAYLAYCFAKNNPDKQQSISGTLGAVADQAQAKRELEKMRKDRRTVISKK